MKKEILIYPSLINHNYTELGAWKELAFRRITIKRKFVRNERSES